MSYEQMTSRRALMMFGHVAEEMVFGRDRVTSGAQSDIEQVTRFARTIATKWDSSPELGTAASGENQAEVLLGGSMGRQQNISEATAQKIDSEVRRIAEDGVNDARCPFTEKQHELDALARGLLGYETLTGEEIRSYLYGRPPVHGSALPAARRGRPRETQVAWSLNRRANQCLAKRVCGPCTCLLEKLLGAEGCGHKHAFRRRSNHALAVQSYLGHKRRRIQHEALH